MAVKVEYFEDNSRGCLGDPELAAEVRKGICGLCFRAVCVSFLSSVRNLSVHVALMLSCWFFSTVRLL